MPLSNVILVFAIILSGCSGASALSPISGSSSSTPTVSAQTTEVTSAEVVELRYDETVQHQQLKLRWLTLKDSRCPIGVNCVWAGQMLATIEVVHSEHGTIELELLRRAGREPQVAQAFGYELRLQEVIPHPKANVIPDRADYKIYIEVSHP